MPVVKITDAQLHAIKDAAFRTRFAADRPQVLAMIDQCLRLIGKDCARLATYYDQMLAKARTNAADYDWFREHFPKAGLTAGSDVIQDRPSDPEPEPIKPPVGKTVEKPKYQPVRQGDSVAIKHLKTFRARRGR